MNNKCFRQVLGLMVRSLIQFFEVTRSGNGSQNNVLYEQMYSKLNMCYKII